MSRFEHRSTQDVQLTLPMLRQNLEYQREYLTWLEKIRARVESRRESANALVKRDPHQWRMKTDIDTAVDQVQRGIAADEGVRFEELQPLVGKPGIDATQQRISVLESEIAELGSFAAEWPTEEARSPYRYTGPQNKAQVDGRYLEPGDVVDLNQRQAQAWRDRFERVAATNAAATR